MKLPVSRCWSVVPVLFSLILSVSSHEIDVHDALAVRDDHHHHHKGAPLLELNETEVTMYHAPTPPSYWTIDIEDREPNVSRHPGLMAAHIAAMSMAFFVSLPLSITLRSVKHTWRWAATLSFYGFIVLGCASSALYRKLTPNMYEGQSHARQSYYVIAISLCLSVIDILHIFRRLFDYLIAIRRGQDVFSFHALWFDILLGRRSEQEPSGADSLQYAGLMSEEPEEYHLQTRVTDDEEEDEHHATAQWADDVHHHRRTYSRTMSEHTLAGSPTAEDAHREFIKPGQSSVAFKDIVNPKKHILRRIGDVLFATVERGLVFAAWAMFTSGIVIYTGGCRENYVNGCLAHLIKGSIFWLYGLVTFGRFLGSFADLGWAWNAPPTGKRVVSAEWIESAVIFFYGITNTWMERWGANPGDPFTTKQIQHISIAVMFWFAGLVGMGMESKRFRSWLSTVATSALQPSQVSRQALREPQSYSASFNPFPALVIGTTGAAMAAHAQTYVFQVQIHMLWGGLLLAFAVLRCLTYFFLWLSPPKSIYPSRPPTEALASFFLACGGLCFMFSTEELTIAAMRKGRDDVMMFLNVAVAFTCFCFCWVLFIVGFKGWIKTRLSSPPSTTPA